MSVQSIANFAHFIAHQDMKKNYTQTYQQISQRISELEDIVEQGVDARCKQP